MSPINIFYIGATGYIGGHVLNHLLNHKNAASFKFTALVRSKEKADKLEAIGIKPVIGSNDDLDKIADLASNADIVFSMADADNLLAIQAVLKGLKKKHEKTGTRPILIHTSGTGVLTDDARGAFAYDTIYDDANADQIATLPITQAHRPVDLEIENADKEGYVYTYIVLPSTIYGIATGRLVDLGIQNPHSIQIPALIKAGIDRGHAGLVGKGDNLWPNVHIDDIAALYIALYDYITSHPLDTTSHGHEGYYFGENGEHRLYDIGKAIQVAFNELGVGKKDPKAEADAFTDEENERYFGGTYLGSNSRCRANRSRSIGWKPVKTTADLLASIKPEVAAWVEKTKTKA